MKTYSVARYRAAGCLRVVAGLSLVVLAVAVFWRPLTRTLGPDIAPAVQRLGLPRLWQPSSAKGFMVRVASEPSGATVSVNGAERGSTPLFANVPCDEGQQISIVVEKQGFPRWQRDVSCRVGKELTVRARLGG